MVANGDEVMVGCALQIAAFDHRRRLQRLIREGNHRASFTAKCNRDRPMVYG